MTVQNPRYLNFSSNTGLDGSRANGKQIIREPKLFLNVRPTADFTFGGTNVSIYGRYDYVGRRYTPTSSTQLPCPPMARSALVGSCRMAHGKHKSSATTSPTRTALPKAIRRATASAKACQPRFSAALCSAATSA